MHRLVPVALIALLLLALPLAATQRPEHGRLFKAEDLGLLEGPDRDVWQRPDQIMDALGIAEGSIVAEIGAASGWFTIRLARRVGPNGFVYAEDVQQPMIEVINRRLPRENLRNVKAFRGEADDPKLPVNALDAILIVDAYHEMEKPVELLRNAARALKDDPPGRIGIVGFNMSGGGPGPAMEERVDAERVIREVNAAGLVLLARPNFLRYQYMLVFGKPKTTPPAKRPTR